MTGISAYADGTININTGSGTGSGFVFEDSVLTITTKGNYNIIGTGSPTNNCIIVQSGVNATISLENVNIEKSYGSPFNMTGSSVKLLLKASNTLKSNDLLSAIQAPAGSTLIIDSKENPGYYSGLLNVYGGTAGAGIGGYGNINAGNITINGGTITATGGTGAAGIGGGNMSSGGTTTINGGMVIAIILNNGYYPACIGGGTHGDAGTILITGGAVVAKGSPVASIGCGGEYSTTSSGSITIKGGTVYATGKGIGLSGLNGPSTPTNITGYAIVFANQINPNASLPAPSLRITEYTIDNNGNVTILEWEAHIFGPQTLTIPNGITLTIYNSNYNNQTLVNGGIIRNFGTIQNSAAINNTGGKIINNGTITGNTPYPSSAVKTGILGEWIQSIDPQPYTGNPIMPDVVLDRSVDLSSQILYQGTDYNVINYSNNVNAGMATITIAGIGNFAGTMTKAFTIHPRSLTELTTTIADIPTSCEYIGDSIKPVITVTYYGDTLILNKDYATYYNNNVNPGEASITITGIGNYSGTISKTFDIAYPADWQSVINVMTVNSNGLGYSYNNNLITINQDGYYQLTGTTTNNRVAVQSGTTATIILDSVNITSSNHTFDISSGSTVTLLLKNSNMFQTTGSNHAGLHVPFGSTLIINSADGSGTVNGALTVNGGLHGAAIGSGANESVTGNITIKGGTVNVYGGSHGGAGIGAGENCGGGEIVIENGNINAYGSSHGAAIGGGYNSSTFGSITINGGIINANSGSSAHAAGIGGGTNTNDGNIEIYGGIINATSGQSGAAIGGGMSGIGGNITIYGGTINANGGIEGAGIGGGQNGSGGNIEIYGGNIIANGGMNSAAGIGGGHGGGAGTFSMNGNAVVFASSISDNSPKTKGILFNDNIGVMYDYVDLEEDVTIPSGKAWTIASDQIFEIQPYVTLTNNGLIYNNGEINNYGTINGSGTIIGNSVFNDNIIDDDYFESYEYEGKMSLKDIFTLNADITGGIACIIGQDNFDDENDFFDPNIDVIVRDKETGTIIYEIYQDTTSYTYEDNNKYLKYYPWDAGESAAFYPSVWNSNDVKASTFAIDKFHKKEYDAGIQSFISDSIDVIVEVIVYNAILDYIKIPGIGELYVEWDNEPNIGLLGATKPDPNKRDCSADENKNKCPCIIWNKIRTVPSNDEIDVIIAPHRGIWGGELGFGAPENSAKAIKNVKTAGLDVVEIDIMRSYDDELVASHDYSFNRLSDFSGGESYWFDQRTVPVWWNPFQVLWWMFSPGGPLVANLKYRNGLIDTDSHYLSLPFILNHLKKNELVALIDIKAITNDYDASYRPTPTVKIDYDRNTPEGREKVKEDWILIFKKCYEVASKKGMLDYIAFKTPYTYEDITGRGGIPETQASYVRFMPMVQPADKQWTRNKALELIDSWVLKAPNSVKEMVIAIETNFNLPNKEGKDSVYFKAFSHENKQYDNLFDYVHQKKFRTGYFSEEPVGVRGVADRYGKWHMPNMFEKKKADPLVLLNVPYFKSSIITTDRPDIWQQLMNSANSTQLLSEEAIDDITNLTYMNNIEQTEITVKYRPGYIIIEGLNRNDVGSNLMLYDLQGRLLYKSKINMAPSIVIAKNLPTGVYILRVSGYRQSSIKLITN
jgi:hypothetical protein